MTSRPGWAPRPGKARTDLRLQRVTSRLAKCTIQFLWFRRLRHRLPLRRRRLGVGPCPPRRAWQPGCAGSFAALRPCGCNARLASGPSDRLPPPSPLGRSLRVGPDCLMNVPEFASLLETLPLIQRWIRRRRLARMRKALLASSPLHQSVFRLIRHEGMSVEQAARHLHLPSRRVEKLLTEVIIMLTEAAR